MISLIRSLKRRTEKSDAQTNMRLLNHGHVVATISNAGNSFACDLFDFLSHDFLLLGTASTHAHCFDVLSLREKPLQQVIILSSTDHRQRRPIYH